ncbi:MAG: hypothetical protein DMF56_09540 [Acidobacteria bacterium]|nr:MAG: hypothetical protein DMF56_09540 [Acidobacteriota bacterium]
MPAAGPTPPEGRMAFSLLVALFFAGFAFGSLHSAARDYRWRNASEVHGVLVKQGNRYHYEYRPKGQPAVSGPQLRDESSSKPDGVVDDWVPVDYDPRLPEQLRRHYSKGRASTNYGQFLITASAGTAFAIASLLCVVAFLRAWSDKRNAATLTPNAP